MRQRTVSGEIDTSRVDAVRLLPRNDDTPVTQPRAWPRATRELTYEIPPPVHTEQTEHERMRTTIWCAVGGLLVAVGLYLVF